MHSPEQSIQIYRYISFIGIDILVRVNNTS